MRKLGFLVVAAGLALGALTGSVASAANEPVQLAFKKQLVDPANLVFEGAVSGDIEGGLVSRLVSVDGAGGEVTHFTFDWIVSAGAQSFTARLYGSLNEATGSVVMNGTVIDGYLIGAQVHEMGQLIDPDSFAFQGLIRIMPATAG